MHDLTDIYGPYCISTQIESDAETQPVKSWVTQVIILISGPNPITSILIFVNCCEFLIFNLTMKSDNSHLCDTILAIECLILTMILVNSHCEN